jgi:hypothetical protein
MPLGVCMEARPTNGLTKHNSFEFLKRKTEEAQAKRASQQAKESATPRQLFLPGMEEFMRAMPNHIARSSLFAPVAMGHKKIHKDAVLVTRGDATIKFWGEQLDEAQADVWMHAMHEAIKVPLGMPVTIERAAFLRAIGRHTGNEQYKWLHRTMQALTLAMLMIEVKTKEGRQKLAIGSTDALHMIEGFRYDNEAGSYVLRIDPRWRDMYGNGEFALIDWAKRLQFGQGQNMAKALQRLVATSNEQVQRYAIDWLKRKLEYSSPVRKFKESLTSALHELERLEVVAGSRIEVSTKGKLQAVWTRL